MTEPTALEGALALAVGAAVSLIRRIYSDPHERLTTAKAYGETMAVLVNDPTWRPEELGAETTLARHAASHGRDEGVWR